MPKKFTGMIVEESLSDNRVLNGIKFVDVRITTAAIPLDRWHIYTVQVSLEDIQRLQPQLKKGTWYMHFWDGDHVMAVFPEKIFEFSATDRETWKPAIAYGLTLGIPREQLDFLIT